ncbi:MAG: hypothetical protein MUE46_06750 [Xanthomonadales bacterium]|jgi:hypothetical protein|nr:hypothetical protein [Xanthomonadales bacterium]
MNTVLLMMLLGTPAEPKASADSPAPPMSAMVVGVPPIDVARTAASPELVEHVDGGVSIVFPEGYLMRTTLRRGFNGVWFTDCGPVPTDVEPQR